MRVLRQAAVTVALVALGCDGDTVARQAPELVLVPDAGATVDFGRLTVGDTVADLRIVARNAGNAALVFLDVRTTAPDRIEVIDAPTSIGPDDGVTFTLRLRTNVAGALDAELVLESNDPERPIARLFVRAVVDEKCRLRFDPAAASFAIGETKSIFLENLTSAPCSVVSVGTDETFFVIENPPELPMSLDAAARRPFDVRHTGTAFSGQPVRRLSARALGGAEAVSTLSGQERTRCLSLDRERLRFNTIPAGGSATSFVNVVSECDHIVSVTDISIQSAEGGFSADTRNLPIVIAPGASGRIDLTFAPGPGLNVLANGVVNIQTDDYFDATLRLPIEGFIIRPRGTVHPTEVRFEPVVYEADGQPGGASICASEIAEVSIYNTGSTPLTVREVVLDSASEFEIVYLAIGSTIAPVVTVPFVVPVGSSARLATRYRPTAVAEHRAQLLVRHDGSERTSVVGLIGSGEPRAMVTEVFHQPTQISVDILWAIDASCSMGEEQEKLIANLSQFVGYADAQGVDYQMAVVEAEEVTPSAGVFRRCSGHPAVIHSSYMTSAIREQVFGCMFDLGVEGVGVESGLGAAREALRLATAQNQNPNTNPNAGFVRDGSELVIVTISDEDDQSSSPDAVLRDFYFSVKGGQRNSVSVHAIAGPLPSGCSTASAGTRYANLTRQTNGQFYSICEADWQPLLRNLGIDVFTPEDQWYLSRPADESTLVVTVDGVAVPNDPTNGWIYEPSRRVVLFTGTAVPPPGAEIVVTYLPGCSS